MTQPAIYMHCSNMALCLSFQSKLTRMHGANLRKRMGFYAAIGFLRNLGVSLEDTLDILIYSQVSSTVK